jgi:hypothetical protein
MRLEAFGIFSSLTTQMAHQIAWVRGLLRLFESKQLFVGETLRHHLQFPASVDANAQVPLQLCLGGKLTATRLAIVNTVCFPVSSERGNYISGKISLSSEFLAFACGF